jgi:hypothetical protein
MQKARKKAMILRFDAIKPASLVHVPKYWRGRGNGLASLQQRPVSSHPILFWDMRLKWRAIQMQKTRRCLAMLAGL